MATIERYIENLNQCTDPAADDQIQIMDASAPAADKDRRLNLGQLALLALANTFAAIATFAQGIAIGVAANRLFRPNAGVVRQTIEWVIIQPATSVVLNTQNAYCMVQAFNATYGEFAEFAVEGAISRMIHGNANHFSGSVVAGKLNIFGEGGAAYAYNNTGAPLTCGFLVWG